MKRYKNIDQTGEVGLQKAMNFVFEQREKGMVIYPEEKNVFEAMELVDLSSIRVVILGQDPYHRAGQAHGLAFSVPEGVKIPPSLRNIYQEITEDIGGVVSDQGDLTERAKQGVLLLNSTLTVQEGEPLSHRKIGREEYTDSLIRLVNKKREGVIFMLRGGHAQKKTKLIDQKKHHILMAPHPSPLSSYRGRFGSKHFSQANNILKKNGNESIQR